MSMSMPQRIKRWRTWAGATVPEMAASAEVTPDAAYMWENEGEHGTTPRQEHLESIVEFFGITLSLFYGEPPADGARRRSRAS